METCAELIQRLLEIQSGGGPRSPELVAEDQWLMDGLQRKNLSVRSLQPKMEAGAPIAGLNSGKLRAKSAR